MPTVLNCAGRTKLPRHTPQPVFALSYCRVVLSSATENTRIGNRSGGARAPTDVFTLATACFVLVMPRDPSVL